jgi:hypothetical protein
MSEASWRGEPSSRRAIDVAIGILMALRRCSERDAFDELAAAVHETGIGLSTLSEALAKLTAGVSTPFPHRDEVLRRWGYLMASTRRVGDAITAGPD